MYPIIACVGLYNSVMRAQSVVNSLLNLVNLDEVLPVFVNTGESIEEIKQEVRRIPHSIYEEVTPAKRPYALVMREKMRVVEKHVSPNALYANIDDDYVFSSWAFHWAKEIFDENPQVEYISLIRTPLEKIEEEEEILGYKFVKTGSTMGGGFVTRTEQFFRDNSEYLMRPNLDLMWDRGFWEWLAQKKNTERFIYMIKDFSLSQHLNLVSNYIEMKNGPDDHMGGLNFIECNPEIYKIQEGEEV